MTTYGGEQRPQGLSSTLPRQYEVPGDEHRDRHAGCQRDEGAAEHVARRQVSSTALLVFCARVERSVLRVDHLGLTGEIRFGKHSPTAATPALLPAALMVDVVAVPASGSA